MSDVDSKRGMALAIKQMRQSEGVVPKVGAVVMNGGDILGLGAKRAKKHAERVAIESALEAGHNLAGAMLFSTLEPCIGGSASYSSCAELIVESGITSVYIGRYDQNATIYRQGWKHLRDAGIRLFDFDSQSRSKIDELNAVFTDFFTYGEGPAGGAKFDFQLNRGNFEIKFSNEDQRSIVTRWSRRGHDSIHAYAQRPAGVALAKYAEQFEEIDDPHAYDLNYTVPVAIGEIAVFASDDGAVLVKVVDLKSGSSSGADERFVRIEFEVRAGAA